MRELFRNVLAFTREGIRKIDVMLDGGKLYTDFAGSPDRITDLEGLYMFPGFADVHVHFREPGFSYKETIKTGSYAAAHGGYTAVCTMPNLKPAPSTLPDLQQELDIINRDSIIHVYPVGAVTMTQSGRGELSHIEEIAPYVCAFSDDGKGIQSGELMREAMKRIADTGKFITAHCEVESELKPGGCIHDGEYASKHGHTGINSASEFLEVRRDIELAEGIGCAFHVCHVSAKESVDLIRTAKHNGAKVTAETAPHYLIFTDMDLQESGNWKMNPPIRSEDDRAELLRGIADGTIDCIITDHAPHSEAEKSRGLDGSAFGVVGLETCFAAMYTHVVREGVISLERLLEMLCVNPRKIFALPGPQYIEDGCSADFVIIDLGRKWRVDPEKFLSMGKSTPFTGMELYGETAATYVDGRKVYDRAGGIVRNA
ncbi:MAG: dihydroorotase [Synergistaceae bacterium]|nr:dihydroorotase [Synergistaceae bacterium]